jgi:hypothetical protein
MRKDQISTLKNLREQLVDALIQEADPCKWPATDSAQGRGDRLWIKKNAIASVELVEQLSAVIGMGASGDLATDSEIERDAARLRKKAGAVLAKHGIKPVDTKH